jgi:hypothetical protein
MPHKIVNVTIYRESSVCFIPVNFDPKGYSARSAPL